MENWQPHEFVVGALIAILLGSLVILAFAAALAPTIIAFRRRHPNRWWVMMVNVFLGGTGAGWIVALFWAMSNSNALDRYDDGTVTYYHPERVPHKRIDPHF